MNWNYKFKRVILETVNFCEERISDSCIELNNGMFLCEKTIDLTLVLLV